MHNDIDENEDLKLDKDKTDVWNKFFWAEQAHWIQNKYSLLEATFALISMPMKRGRVMIGQLKAQEAEYHEKPFGHRCKCIST